LKGWLLDTNVLSEMARSKPDVGVLAWLRSLPEDRAFVSVLTIAEIDQGVASLKTADPRRATYETFRNRIEAEFAGRVTPLDDETIRLWGRLSGDYRREFGGKAPVIDTMLAATATRRRLYLATRNAIEIGRLGCSVFNPWSDDVADFPLQS